MENAIKLYRIPHASSVINEVFKDAPGIARQYILGANSFTGILRESSANDKIILEGYFNDVYKLFLRRLSQFECSISMNEEESFRLKSLLDELLKVKALLCEISPDKENKN